MAFATIVPFDRALTGTAVAGDPGRRYTDVEIAALKEEAYRRGFDAARVQADQQVVELRANVVQLRDGVFAGLAAVEPSLIAQLRDTLPALATDIARRLLAGFEPAPETVARICEEALAEILPERAGLEIILSPRDAALLEEGWPHWSTRYPGLRITANPALLPGDCQVRSRFGLTDARLRTKLEALQHSLAPK